MAGSDLRRRVPSVDQLLIAKPAVRALEEQHGRPLVRGELRRLLEELRRIAASADEAAFAARPGSLAADLGARVRRAAAPSLIPVINATGVLAGYRNRMVHFYQNVTEEELYTICTSEIADVLAVRDAFVSWLRNNPECIDNFMP